MIHITHTLLPDPSILSKCKVADDKTIRELKKRYPDRDVFYTYFYEDPEKRITITARPVFAKGGICHLSYRSKLMINADGYSPNEIASIVKSIFGTLDGARVSYVEARVDLIGYFSMDEVGKCVTASRKRCYLEYKGETFYFGSRSYKQVKAYDKGKQKYGLKNSHYIRFEIGEHFYGRQKPDLRDWLSGSTCGSDPFGGFTFVTPETLDGILSSTEKIYWKKYGLHRLLRDAKKISKRRKDAIRKAIKGGAFLDFNVEFNSWAQGWHSGFNASLF